MSEYQPPRRNIPRSYRLKQMAVSPDTRGNGLPAPYEATAHDITTFTVSDLAKRRNFLHFMPETGRHDSILAFVTNTEEPVVDEKGPLYLEFPAIKSRRPIHRVNRKGEVVEEIPYDSFTEYMSKRPGARFIPIFGIPTSFPDLEPMILTRTTNSTK